MAVVAAVKAAPPSSSAGRATAKTASSASPPRSPRIPLDVLDAPTQRLYVVASLVLLQAFKLSQVVFPSSSSEPASTALLDWDGLFLGSKLLKWISFDLAFVAFVVWLSVPRFDAGWKLPMLLRLVLVASDYILFGQWKVSRRSIHIPANCSPKRLMSTVLGSVRISSVIGTDRSHLRGEYTVHILAVSTAHLDTSLLSKYCLTSSSTETIHLPLRINNTLPSKIVYSIKKPGSDETRLVMLTSADLVQASSSGGRTTSRKQIKNDSGARDDDDDDDDVDATLASWGALVPSSSASSRKEGSSASGSASSSDRRASSTENLYYIPIKEVGEIRLESVHDADGTPIKIRRHRLASALANNPLTSPLSSLASDDRIKIITCPRAGLRGPRESHICSTEAASWDLGLSVKGKQPLSVRWYSREGEVGTLTSRKIEDGIEGIVSPSEAQDNAIIPVPMNVSLTNAATRGGKTTFFLERVTDAAGNEVVFSNHQTEEGGSHSKKKSPESRGILKGMSDSRSVTVHRPPEVQFVGVCGKGEDVNLLQGKTAALNLRLTGVEAQNGAAEGWKIVVRFTSEQGHVREQEMPTTVAPVQLAVNEPGAYEIVSVKSKWCQGSVLVPSSCTVVSQPLPSLTTSFKPVHDVCNLEVGSIATLHMTGKAPFTIHYELVSAAAPHRPTRMRHRILHARDELRLEPPGPGEWEYRFLRVADANYPDGIDLANDDPTYRTKQKIDPISDAAWVNPRERKIVHSCEGESLEVQVDLKGTAPWEIEYSLVGQGTKKVGAIKTQRYAFEVAVPSSVAKRGGQFAISLESVKDANGCRRTLNTDDLIVDVRRTKPTARFHGAEGARSITIRDNENARIPLRLTGEGPWTVTYRPPSIGSTPSQPLQFKSSRPNVDLDIENPRPGTYELLGVRDSYCPGDVSETDWSVSMIERPSLQIVEGLKGNTLVKNGSIIRRGVCENVVDSTSIRFKGKAPYKGAYTLTKGGHASEKLPRTLASIQSTADLTLFTGAAGHHTYTFTGVGDSVYSNPSERGLVAPTGGRSGVVRIEQDVWPLPSTKFTHGPKQGFCVKDKIESRGSDDLILHLEGTPPFNIEIEVKDEGHRHTKEFAIDRINSHDWPVSVPFRIDSPSPHTITVRRVVDAHGCERMLPGLADASVTLSVAEIASITPVLPTIDACVGETLDYIVQGAPPFTVKYEFEGKAHSAALAMSKFSRLASAPGTFKIISVGHENDQCRSNDVDLYKKIHPIPTASVSEGDSIVVDIREGDQTEIVFSFTGTPPFSFTYSRRRPQDRSKDKTVLETHTVVGITEHKYSILTRQEGTWSVSYIADRYCSWPLAAKAGSSDAIVKA
ncbi:BQ5605_C012g06967 [Microbotryum silenes-dioicae]|uniref:BQ5605_C012g06967 protein n=1 Tax=Microbotryum silenes-dioicae TaxID=796604 RepID=A0A2X0ME04_9BASI|nr:BQ5605_C012g06967 [Microbotryum silenes-dioicae]